jgi:hypothetical protein
MFQRWLAKRELPLSQARFEPHKNEVMILPTTKRELGLRAAGDRLGTDRLKDAVRCDVQEDPKNAVLLETMREKELVANFPASSRHSLCNSRILP